MTRLRKYYIKKRESLLNYQNAKFTRLIFNRDIIPHPTPKTSQILQTKQKFPKFLGNWAGGGGITLEYKIKVYNELGLYLREIPLNLIAIQVKNKWYTGPLITKSRFDQPMEQLLYLLLKKQGILNKNNTEYESNNN